MELSAKTCNVQTVYISVTLVAMMFALASMELLGVDIEFVLGVRACLDMLVKKIDLQYILSLTFDLTPTHTYHCCSCFKIHI